MKALQFNVNVLKYVAAKSLHKLFGKQVFYKGPVKTVQLAEVPEPVLPSEDWVKIKTIYCGFCGSDLNLMLLHDSPTASPFTSFPSVIGHEMIGEILETGAGVKKIRPGDRVAINPVLGCEARSIDPLCPSCASGRSGNCENLAEGMLPPGMFTGVNSKINGGFAPYMVAHQSQLFKIPKGLNYESAVMTEPLAVALQTVYDNMPADGEHILIIGGGVIGNLIIQSARALVPNCRVSVIEPSPAAAKLALETGADHIISASKLFKETACITGGTVYKPMIGDEILMGGFNRIYDSIGKSSTLNLSLRILAAKGTLSVVGIGGDVTLDLTPLWLKLQTVKGVYSYGMVKHNGQKRHVFEIALDLLHKGKIKADVLVTHKFRIDEYHKMIEVNMNKGKHGAIKTIVSFVE